MPDAELPDFDPASLRDAVDVIYYSRGVQYARQNAVAQLRWDPSRNALQGLVRGSGGGFYTTIAMFSPAGNGRRTFERGVCSCPVGTDCKHVIALVLTAAQAGAAAAAGAVAGSDSPTPGESGALALPSLTTVLPAPGQPAGPAAPRRPAWEARLDSVLSGGAEARAAGPGSGVPRTPLAIEFRLSPGTTPSPAARWQQEDDALPKLAARLVQPGRNGGWVTGSLSWSRLESLSHYGHYSPAQVQVLAEIYSLYRSGSGRYGYYRRMLT